MRIQLYNNPPAAPSGNEADNFAPYMDTFLVGGACSPLGLVVVLPGGGYSHRAFHEGDPIAQRFNQLGFHAVTVQYRCKPYTYPAGLNDVARAIRIIRANAEKWKVDPNKIAVCGFSAGGHLAGTSGLYYKDATHVEGDEADQFSARPDAMLLCYPVIAATEEFSHKGSANNLLGVDAPLEARMKMDLHKAVTEDTPPAFIWHTVTDQVVPVQNALAFGNAMIANNRLCEMHIFPEGPHGRGLGFACHALGQWTALAANFLSVTLGFPRGSTFNS